MSASMGSIFYVNAGKVILGSNTALGTDNELDLSSPSSVLDLAGHSVAVSKFVTSNNFMPGNAARSRGIELRHH